MSIPMPLTLAMSTDTETTYNTVTPPNSAKDKDFDVVSIASVDITDFDDETDDIELGTPSNDHFKFFFDARELCENGDKHIHLHSTTMPIKRLSAYHYLAAALYGNGVNVVSCDIFGRIPHKGALQTMHDNRKNFKWSTCGMKCEFNVLLCNSIKTEKYKPNKKIKMSFKPSLMDKCVRDPINLFKKIPTCSTSCMNKYDVAVKNNTLNQAFFDALSRHSAIIGGSFSLSMLIGTEWNDIDVFSYNLDFISWFIGQYHESIVRVTNTYTNKYLSSIVVVTRGFTLNYVHISRFTESDIQKFTKTVQNGHDYHLITDTKCRRDDKPKPKDQRSIMTQLTKDFDWSCCCTFYDGDTLFYNSETKKSNADFSGMLYRSQKYSNREINIKKTSFIADSEYRYYS
jgi:hypothetical protein